VRNNANCRTFLNESLRACVFRACCFTCVLLLLPSNHQSITTTTTATSPHQVIAVDLAKQLLKARPNALALVVSTENLTQNLYLGNDRSMLLQNTLFRCGGAALLLSNRRSDSLRAKFKLLHTLRKQVGRSLICLCGRSLTTFSALSYFQMVC